MNFSDYSQLDAIAINQAITDGETTQVEITDIAIAAIEKLNPDLNAVVMKNYDNALKAANNKQNSKSPIAGTPFLIKDANVFTHDMPTTFSCRFFDGVAPRPDSEIVKRWRNAGVNIIGKSNTPEFAEDFVCESTFRGPALNPWNTGHTTGGSSGGAASAVAAGMVPVAHATDLGGSIRIPAACCGVFGLKPTSGLSPVDFAQSELASGFNSDHVVSRTVRDSAAFLDATAHPIPGYRHPVSRSVESYLDHLNSPVADLRIGVCTNTAYGEKVPDRQRQTTLSIASLLEQQGHEIVEYQYPADLQFGEWMDILWMFDVVYEMDKRIDEIGREPEPDELEAMTRHIRKRISHCSAMDHYRARLTAHQNSIKLINSIRDLDIVLTPSLGSDPILVGELDSRTDAFKYETWAEQGNRFAPYSYICNITGQPSASVPVIDTKESLPGAVQLAAHTGKDHLVLQLAAQIEALRPWTGFKPGIWIGNE